MRDLISSVVDIYGTSGAAGAQWVRSNYRHIHPQVPFKPPRHVEASAGNRPRRIACQPVSLGSEALSAGPVIPARVADPCPGAVPCSSPQMPEATGLHRSVKPYRITAAARTHSVAGMRAASGWRLSSICLLRVGPERLARRFGSCRGDHIAATESAKLSKARPTGAQSEAASIPPEAPPGEFVTSFHAEVSVPRAPGSMVTHTTQPPPLSTGKAATTCPQVASDVLRRPLAHRPRV